MSPHRTLIVSGWNDGAPHLSDEFKDRLFAVIPTREISARVHGIPAGVRPASWRTKPHERIPDHPAASPRD
jgi:hypothetical protein